MLGPFLAYIPIGKSHVKDVVRVQMHRGFVNLRRMDNGANLKTARCNESSTL